MLATLLGAPLGASIGILIGYILIGRLGVRRAILPFLASCDLAADADPAVPMPDTAGKPVTFFQKALLKDTSPSLVHPDYDRLLFLNRLLTLLWPHLSPALHKEALRRSAVPVAAAVARVPGVRDVRLDRLDLGERPPRLDSVKAYHTAEDELVFEAPLFWGGDAAVRATVVLGGAAGPAVDLPIDVANVQLKALARITIRPLVEQLPCVGGVTLSLLEEPTVDLEVRVADSPDLLALPMVPFLLKTAIKLGAGRALVYPNEISVPLMPGFGLPPPPEGMLSVKVVAGHDLKGGLVSSVASLIDEIDPYVKLEVREGRAARTATVQNAVRPLWGEDLDLVLDDAAMQTLRVTVLDDNVVADAVLGGAALRLDGAAFLATAAPGAPPLRVRVPIFAPRHGGALAEIPASALPAFAEFAQADVAAAEAALARAAAAGIRSKGLIYRAVQRRAAAKGRKKAAAALAVTTAAAVAASAAGGSDEGGEDGGGSAFGTGAAASEAGTPRATFAAAALGALPLGALGRLGRKGRGGGAGPPVGSVTLELRFRRFAGAGGAPPGPAAAAPDGAPGAAPPAAARAAVTSVRKSLLAASLAPAGGAAAALRRGVLTLDLKKVAKLAAPADTYVVARLYDPARRPEPVIEARTRVEVNEAAPRFNFRADFVNVSPAAVLTLTVFEQPGLLASLTSLRVPLLMRAAPKAVGRVRLPLAAVAAAGRVRDVYPLADAQTGEVHCALEWQDVDVAAAAEAEAEAGAVEEAEAGAALAAGAAGAAAAPGPLAAP